MKSFNALITGGSRGLGRALAIRLAEQGARVVVVARDLDPLQQVVEEIQRRGGEAYAIAADIGVPEEASRIAGAATAILGRVDVLIHNASTLGPVPLRPLLDIPAEAFESAMQVNLLGPFRLTRALVGQMALAGSGLVVHISSDAAIEAYPGWGVYSTTKAALDHLGRVWAAELADQGVRFPIIDPGEMNTQMHADAIPDADPNTLASPEAVAETLFSVLSDTPTGTRLSIPEVQP